MRVPEVTEREPGFKVVFDGIMKENFPYLDNELGNKIQEGHRTHNRVDKKPSSP